jgi:hypothetical protein
MAASVLIIADREEAEAGECHILLLGALGRFP